MNRYQSPRLRTLFDLVRKEFQKRLLRSTTPSRISDGLVKRVLSSSRPMTSVRASMPPYTITLLGDIVLARLIDQLLPFHVDDPESAQHVAHFRQRFPLLAAGTYNHASPWGNTLSFLHKSHLVLGNLETAVTTHEVPWPDKVFNYRMHPENAKCLQEARISYVSLANNHTLDFERQGLEDTVTTVRKAGIATAGASQKGEDVERPAILSLASTEEKPGKHEVHLYSFSDHPRDWRLVQEFNSMTYTDAFREKAKRAMTKHHEGLVSNPALKIVSCHWGPNYQWHPDSEIISMAHFFIDECGVDLIHGHSSHHIQGVEVYKGKLIIYGCGDFVDDYAVTPGYRNDLSAAWNVIVQEDNGSDKLKPVKLEVFPNRIKHFQAGLLSPGDEDHEWVKDKLTQLSKTFGTDVEEQLGSEGQVIVHIFSLAQVE